MGSELTDLQTYLRILLYTKSLTGTTASGANNLSVKSNMPDNTFENFWMFIFVSGQLVTEGSVWWGGGVAAQQRRRRNCQIFLETSPSLLIVFYTPPTREEIYKDLIQLIRVT